MQDKIFVYAGWKNDQKIGTIYHDVIRGEEKISFKYDDNWIFANPSLCLDPTLPISPYVSYPIDGILFGMFQDSCPDRWGRKLIDARESLTAEKEHRQPKKFFDIDYMLQVDDFSRSGGLRFKRDENGPFLNDDKLPVPPISSIRELEQVSLGYETKDGSLDWTYKLVNPGSSLGGARPKANVLDTDGSLWIAKFPSKNDTYDVGAWEKVMFDLAKECGLIVPETRLCKFSSLGSTLLSKRFDRSHTPNGDMNRIHYASGLTMLGLRDGNADDVGYLDLTEAIEKITVNPNLQLYRLFQNLIFDIAISNHDDHLRNHGFLLINDAWELSPIFDINPEPNEQTLSLNIDMDSAVRSFDTAIETAPFYHLSKEEGEAITLWITSKVSELWERTANKYGINREDIRMMKPAFILAQEEAKRLGQKDIIISGKIKEIEQRLNVKER